MGLFDGRLADGHGSTAQVAGLLGAPVVLVVDARGQSRSLAALLHGFRSFDPAAPGRGGGAQPGRAARGTRRCCARPPPRSGCRCSARCPGATRWPCRRGTSGWSPPPSTGPAATAAVDAMAELVAAHVDLDAVVRLASRCPPGRRGIRRPSSPRPRRMYADAACAALERTERRFRYTGTGRWWRSRGRGVHLRLRRARRAARGRGARGRGRRPAARRAPARRHGGARAARRVPRGARRRAGGQRRRCAPRSPALAASGAPVHAECGGLLYLCEELDGDPDVRRAARPAPP